MKRKHQGHPFTKRSGSSAERAAAVFERLTFTEHFSGDAKRSVPVPVFPPSVRNIV